MKTIKKVVVKRSYSKHRLNNMDDSSEMVLTINVLQETPLAKVKEKIPRNRAIQSLSNEEYDNYIERLTQTSKLLAIVDS